MSHVLVEHKYKFLPDASKNPKSKTWVQLSAFIILLSLGICTCFLLFFFRTENFPCPPGYTLSESTKYCHRLVLSSTNMEKAAEECENDGGKLVSITDDGFVCKKPNGNKFKRSKRRRLLVKSTPDYTWYPNYWYKASIPPANFTDARKQCVAEGGDLVSVHSEEEMNIVNSIYLRALERYKTETKPEDRKYLAEVWIGLVYDSDAEKWTWTDGSKVDYENWVLNEPKQQDKKRWAQFHAGTIKDIRSIDQEWNNVMSDAIGGFVCKKLLFPHYSIGMKTTTKNPTIITPSPSTPSTTSITSASDTAPVTTTSETPGRCDPGYKRFRMTKRCYKCVLEPKNFENAKKQCSTDGGDLAMIYDPFLSEFVSRLYFETWESYKLATNTTSTGINLWVAYSFASEQLKWYNRREKVDVTIKDQNKNTKETYDRNIDVWGGEIHPYSLKFSDNTTIWGNWWYQLAKDQERGFVCVKATAAFTNTTTF